MTGVFVAPVSAASVVVEEDLPAQSQYDLIVDTLSRYNKPWSAVKFLV
ncbi:hypothetical protein PF003_g29822 [Phytophthora fragariae]|nr:hypothetical protein PF003_g29822 [Phytophthora fragariae]